MKNPFYDNRRRGGTLGRAGAGLKAWAASHRAAAAILAVTIAVGGYKMYSSADATGGQYAIAQAAVGSIVQKVSGAGVISAENQLEVASKAAGEITSIPVKVGDRVAEGDLLATIDAAQARRNLESARLAYEKLVAPPKEPALSNAEGSVTKSYSDAFSSIAAAFTDAPAVLNGLKTLVYGQSGFLAGAQFSIQSTAVREYISLAGSSYDAAANLYDSLVGYYKATARSSPAAAIDSLLASTTALVRAEAKAAKDSQNAINLIIDSQRDYGNSRAIGARDDVNGWSNTVNSDLNALVSAENGIRSSINSLSSLVEGADPLDVRSQALSLASAESTYEDYFVRAPFDGIVGRLPTAVHATAGGSTVIATIISNRQIATISLNEVDAAKLEVGQPVIMTFDAIDGLTATGTVSQVDLVGTVSQGVVVYGVKIAVGTADPRIKPGMSVNASIETARRNGVVIIPSSAVRAQGSRSYVQTVPAQDAAAAVRRGPGQTANTTLSAAPKYAPVVTGLADDSNTEVTVGLSAGDWVVVKAISASGTSSQTPNIFSAIGGNRTVRTNVGGAGHGG